MGIRCLIKIHIPPSHLQVFRIGKILKLWPNVVRNIGAPKHDPSMPAVVHQINYFVRLAFTWRERFPDRCRAGAAAKCKEQQPNSNHDCSSIVITVAPCSLQTRVIYLIILGKQDLGLEIGIVEKFILSNNTRQVLICIRCNMLVAHYC